MPQKTPFKIMGKLQIQRSDNGNILERDINLSAVIENAVVEHISGLLSITEGQALNLIAQWRIRTIWIDEPME